MFRVEWLREAVGELAELWTEADSPFRQAITEANHALDQELQADPFRVSESREGMCGFRSPNLSPSSSKSIPSSE
jgi:hypothetical protein